MSLSQKNEAIMEGEELVNSFPQVTIPNFDTQKDILQYIHELLLEGDEAKVTASLYKMFPRSYFIDGSDAVLNRTGEDVLKAALKDLKDYKLAFCQYPIVRELGSTHVSFYNRSKKRFNRLYASYEDDKWCAFRIEYTIRNEDLAGFKENGDTYCEGKSIVSSDKEPVSNESNFRGESSTPAAEAKKFKIKKPKIKIKWP